ncbi:MAG: recombinase family protein [Clostridiales bacterium]|jgi:DNA invertase Pin-like site-specific DNA recombinase|nr:recombinase family protein [Clostridiales bacterium]
MDERKYRAVKYIRLSVADGKKDRDGSRIEKIESDSVANQRKFIDEWLSRHPEIEAVSEEVDDGFSGLLFDRPAFKHMMEDIESGKIDCCITRDLSRFGREYIETGRYLRRIFPAYGVRFIAINDSIDTLDDSGDDLAMSLKSIINDAYCRDISIKTRSALKVKRQCGDHIGAFAVYGYRKSDENRNLLVPDDYAAKVVRDIFAMKLGGLSASRIAASLNGLGILAPARYKKDRGMPCAGGGFSGSGTAKWCPNTIIRILKDETYTGTLVQGKTETPNYKLKEICRKPESEWVKVENAHEPVIAKADFELAQRLMRLDTRTAPGGGSVYVFSGLLVCGCCGNRMVRKSAPGNGKRYYNYWCPTTKKGGCARSAMIKEDALAAAVLENVKAHVASVASLETLIAGLDAGRVGRELAARLAEQLDENERRLEKIREFKAGLYENMTGGNLSKDEYRSLKAKYGDDADILAAANERLKQEIDDALSCKHERMAWLERFRQFESLGALDRKTVATLIRRIRIVGKREIEIEWSYQSEYETVLAMLKREVA